MKRAWGCLISVLGIIGLLVLLGILARLVVGAVVLGWRMV